MASEPFPSGADRPAEPPTPAQDARGIIDPQRLQQHVTLARHPAGPELADLVAWFWYVSWSLPPGAEHTQHVLTHPGANLWVGCVPPSGPRVEACVEGVQLRLSTRRLAGAGWTVAALTTPGGLAAFTDCPARLVTDRALPWDAVVRRHPGLRPAADLVAECAPGEEEARVHTLRAELGRVAAAADPLRVHAARATAAIARQAECDRGLRRAEDLAALAGVTLRTLQRQFADHVGASPAWVLRRYRLLDAAEQARGGAEVDWADVAADLGYSDQSHLVRDFRHHLGTTPAAYARQAAGAGGRS